MMYCIYSLPYLLSEQTVYFSEYTHSMSEVSKYCSPETRTDILLRTMANLSNDQTP